MICRAIITKVPEEGSNKFEVDVKYLNSNVNQSALFEATLCYSPDTFNGYSVGDLVYVSFLDDRLNEAIILGKMYTTETKKDSSNTYIIANQLKVTGLAELPDNTTIAGYGAEDFFNFTQKLANISTGGGDIGFVITGGPW